MGAAEVTGSAGTLTEVTKRLRRLTGEVARFSAVNTVATIVALFLFNALVHGVRGWFGGPMNGDPIPAYLVANSVGMFVSRNVFGWDSIYADNVSGNVIGALLGNAFRFWAFRRFVFKVRSPLVVEHVAEEPAERLDDLIEPPRAATDQR